MHGLLVALSGIGSWHSAVARADEANVSLVVRNCDDAEVSSDGLTELVRTEVAPAQLSTIGAESRADIRGEIELCHDGSPQLVKIAVIHGRLTRERIVNLSDVRTGLRERTLAVVFGEMLTELPAQVPNAAPSSAPEAAARPSQLPPVIPSGTARSLPTPAGSEGKPNAQPPRQRRVDVGSGGSLRQFASPATTFLGPWLSIGSGAWQFEGLFLKASTKARAGTVGLYDINLAAAWTPLQLGSVPRISLALRGEVGIAWAVGSPGTNSRAVGSTQRAEQLALLVEPRLDVPFSTALAVEARFSAGVARGPTATEDRVARATCNGPFIGTALGLHAVF